MVSLIFEMVSLLFEMVSLLFEMVSLLLEMVSLLFEMVSLLFEMVSLIWNVFTYLICFTYLIWFCLFEIISLIWYGFTYLKWFHLFEMVSLIWNGFTYLKWLHWRWKGVKIISLPSYMHLLSAAKDAPTFKKSFIPATQLCFLYVKTASQKQHQTFKICVINLLNIFLIYSIF